MQVEHPPSAIHELGGGNSHQGSRGHVTDPVPVVVDSRPANAGGEGIQSYAGPWLPDVVSECRRHSKCHGGVSGGHRILTGKRNETIGVQALTGAGPAEGQLGHRCGSPREQQGGGQSAAGSGQFIVSGDQAGTQEAQCDGAIDLRLPEVPERSGYIIAAGSAVILGIALNRIVQERESRESADCQRPLPPLYDMHGRWGENGILGRGGERVSNNKRDEQQCLARKGGAI